MIACNRPKVDLDILIKRDIKSLYKYAIEGKIKNVVGVDIEFPEPKSHMIIDNNSNDSNFKSKINHLYKTLISKNLL